MSGHFDLPSDEDAAYEAARNDFERKRDALIDKATDAHERGDDAEAERLLAQAKAMVFTGLYWENGEG